jgi:HSP20 family protein
MERFFDRFFRDWGVGMPSTEEQLTGAYPVDIREEDNKLVVDAEMPGFKREEIDVSIDNGMLTIKAERKPPETKGTKHLSERRYTRVERSFTLPSDVDESKVNAKLSDGVLHIELPETKESKAKHISVS